MEFEDDHEMHGEEEDDEEEEDIALPEGYNTLGNTEQVKMPTSSASPTTMRQRYRECLKNHAVGIGGHAVDGCGEFMPAGVDGTLDALKCAACNCHRNFHRKETDVTRIAGLYQNQQQFSPYYRTPAGYLHLTPPNHRPLALPSPYSGDQDDRPNPRGFGGVGTGSSKKRFRTKFTAEQKERMMELAEKLGWRIQKHDEAVVQHFCNETGVKRHVLKVWMHNNKHSLGKKPI